MAKLIDWSKAVRNVPVGIPIEIVNTAAHMQIAEQLVVIAEKLDEMTTYTSDGNHDNSLELNRIADKIDDLRNSLRRS